MSLSDILVHVRHTDGLSTAVATGLRLAKQFDAFLTAVNVVPLDPPAVFTLPEAAALQFLTSDREFELARGRRDWWLEVLRQYGVTGEWRPAQGDVVEALGYAARFADLLITELSPAGEQAPLGWGLAERVVFGVGVPVLILPDKPLLSHFGDSMVIAWNGTREAARAVHAALPWLRLAKRVVVLRGADKPHPQLSRHLPTLRLEHHLERHGVAAIYRPFEASDRHAGEAILAAAHEENADLLVMGAWGHSRLSELFVGGATRHLLQHGDLPLFVAH